MTVAVSSPRPAPPIVKPVAVRSLWKDALGRLVRNRLSLIGLAITLIFVFLAIFGPYLAPYAYQQQDLRRTNELPSMDHWLGTDGLGRDFLSRVMWGARTAIIVASFVTSISVTLGILLGGVAAYLGGLADAIVGRVIDVAQSVPTIMLAILVDAAVKKPVSNAFEAAYQATGIEFLRGSILLDYLITLAAIAAVSWPAYARLIRGQIFSLRQQGYVEAARATGVPGGRILLRHIVPNALGPIIVAATFGFSNAMVLEASLSYLGIGIQPPAASWGAMINDNLHQWRIRPYLVAVPAVVLGIATLAVNFLGDGLNDALNPRARASGKK